ncbi:MAG: 1-acyl-sn-glycerol-3-phosphate acyltransferase [Burkholderiales bacterium]|nr:1-acyl-sn-glycerol-3-phosphate acyltransferase [Burkholderiales bacterium]
MTTGAARPRAATEIAERTVSLRGSRLARALLRLAGWRVLFDGLPAAQGVAVVYPHTSNWDFVVGLLAKWAIGLPIVFWGKDSLFKVPLFGGWLRWLGGRPVVRHAPQGAVAQMAAQLRQAREQGQWMWLALAPEGTRGRTEGWRSGFYHLATQAGVPVGLVVLDYGRRRVGFDSFWVVSGDLQADLASFARRLAGCRGLRARLAAPVRPLIS